MKVVTKVPQTIITQLKNNRTVYPKTNFNNYSKRAYQILSRMTQMSNFFFGFKTDNHIFYKLSSLLSQSSKENTQSILLEIPDDLIFEHDYYDFSSLIYWCEGYEGYDEEIITDLTNAIKFGDQPQYVFENEPRQVIYPYLKPEWVVNYNPLL